MRHQIMAGMAALTAVFAVASTSVQAFDESKYPDWSGAWRRITVPGITGQPAYDPTKRLGKAQNAPLTPEAMALLEASIADQAKGGQGNYKTYTCLAPGMPRAMTPYGMLEFVITPDTTHVLLEHIHDARRIFTDGRDWPAKMTPTLAGYSIGKWIDSDGDGRFDTLEVETRGFRGPRTFDASGMPLHADNKTIVKERIKPDPSNPNVLHNEMTTIDSSLTRPWTVTKKYGRDPKETVPAWEEENCAEGNGHVEIRGEGFFLSAEGHLMPAKKDQPPPDLRNFNQAN
jgi:hypothetical protein